MSARLTTRVLDFGSRTYRRCHYAELVKPSTDVPPTTFRSVEPKPFERILGQTLAEPKLTERPILVLPVSKYFASVYKICQSMVDSSSKPGDA